MWKSPQEQIAERKKENSAGQLPFKNLYLRSVISFASYVAKQQEVWTSRDANVVTFRQFTRQQDLVHLSWFSLKKEWWKGTKEASPNKVPRNLFPACFTQKELFLVNPFLFLDIHLNNTPNNHNKNLVFHPPEQKLFLDIYMDLQCQFIMVARLMERWNLRDKNVLYYLNMSNAMKPSGRGNCCPKELPRILTNPIGKTN